MAAEADDGDESLEVAVAAGDVDGVTLPRKGPRRWQEQMERKLPVVPEGDNEVLAGSDVDSVPNRAEVLKDLVGKQPYDKENQMNGGVLGQSFIKSEIKLGQINMNDEESLKMDKNELQMELQLAELQQLQSKSQSAHPQLVQNQLNQQVPQMSYRLGRKLSVKSSVKSKHSENVLEALDEKNSINSINYHNNIQMHHRATLMQKKALENQSN